MAGGLTLGSLTLTNIESTLAIFQENINGVAIIDMGADNYTMTNAEAEASYRILSNVGTGKTLTFPSSADALVPTLSIMDLRLAAANVSVVLETGGSALTLYSGSVTVIAVNATLTEIQDMCAVCAQVSNSITNGVTITDTASNTFTLTDAGKKTIFNAAGAQTWTIDTVANTGWRENAVLYIYAQAGSGGITVTGEAGVTLSPASIACAAGQGATIAKDGTTNNWHRVA